VIAFDQPRWSLIRTPLATALRIQVAIAYEVVSHVIGRVVLAESEGRRGSEARSGTRSIHR
jgi:hypothetical protein